MYVTGHYEFEIVIKNLRKNIQNTIYRRFSDLEILHEGLIKYNPGCRIVPIPEKSLWCNLYVNNDTQINKRKKQIEEYLNYINYHKYLCKNPIFRIFLSDDFERYKNEKNQKITFYDQLIFVKSFMPNLQNIFSSNTSNYFLENNEIKSEKIQNFSEKEMEKEKDNIIRLEKGILECIKINEILHKSIEEKINSLKNIFSITKSFEHTSLKLEQSEHDEDFKNSKQSINKNMEIIFNLYDKNKSHTNMLLFNLENLKVKKLFFKSI